MIAEAEVRPTSPWRMPRGSADRTLRVERGVARRLLDVDGSPVIVRAWQAAGGGVRFRAESVDPVLVADPVPGQPPVPADAARLELAIERMRFALGVDDDLSDIYRRFRRDRLVGPLLRRMPDFRPRRRPWPWEALVQAIVKQLIESDRAARIERRIVGRWGLRLGEGREALRDVPSAATLAGRAPAELASMDLAPSRAAALRQVAREVIAGRFRLDTASADGRLLALPQIGPWTIQCLGLFGRGEFDSLPAGDLAYIKLVGRLAGLGRRATIPEVEEFYAPYAPYRGFVGTLTLTGLHRLVAHGPPLRMRASV